jgi:hypothetical protein
MEGCMGVKDEDEAEYEGVIGADIVGVYEYVGC